MTISLPESLEQFVEQQVSAGGYARAESGPATEMNAEDCAYPRVDLCQTSCVLGVGSGFSARRLLSAGVLEKTSARRFKKRLQPRMNSRPHSDTYTAASATVSPTGGAAAASGSNFTLTNLETPGSCMVTP
jgi:hypothetical protein